MEIRLDDRVALVTGGASGIGEAAATLLAQAGATVIVGDVAIERAHQVAAGICERNGRAEAVALDVASDDSVNATVDALAKRYKRIDIAVNSAGIMRRLPMEQIRSQDWDEIIGVNVKGTFFVSRAVVRVMKTQSSGRIINVASNGGKTGTVVSGCHYAASKAAVISLTKSFARLLAASGITVNAVSPGPTLTPPVAQLSPEELARLRSIVPLGRLGTPQEIGAVIVFLASDLSAFITGEIVDVDGGITMD